jgi:hypothetical protein
MTDPQLPREGELPGFGGATGWLNSEPLTPAGLEGRVVLVEFLTFTCINWIRTLPYVRAWWGAYRDHGLTVIGVHTPEFLVEQNVDDIRRRMAAMRVEFPIAIDNDYGVWRAFGNQYWPALYFADAQGTIRHHRFGEGEYEYSELVLRTLLGAAGADIADRERASVDPQGVEAAADWDDLGSPETYLGYARADSFASPEGAAPDRSREYSSPERLAPNQWALAGEWTIGSQPAVLNSPSGRILHRFRARDLHLVLGPGSAGEPVRFRVTLDGQPPGAAHGLDTDEEGRGTVSETRLYQLVRQPGRVTERLFEVTFEDPGLHAYVFTFG